MDGVSVIDRALILLVMLELAVLGLFWFDKAQARNHGPRIPEQILLLVALFGGLGAWLGQHLLRHKTRKEPFRTRLGFVLTIHLVGVAGIIWALLTYA